MIRGFDLVKSGSDSTLYFYLDKNKNGGGKNNTCITCPAVLQCISVNIDNVIYSLLQSEV